MKDPRIERRPRHYLTDIITIVICAVICGADSWVAVEEFAKAKEQWLRTFLKLPNGIPSHDTFGR
ncbi:MAG: transposase family protein, partial [Anaerolineae bacterium]